MTPSVIPPPKSQPPGAPRPGPCPSKSGSQEWVVDATPPFTHAQVKPINVSCNDDRATTGCTGIRIFNQEGAALVSTYVIVDCPWSKKLLATVGACILGGLLLCCCLASYCCRCASALRHLAALRRLSLN